MVLVFLKFLIYVVGYVCFIEDLYVKIDYFLVFVIVFLIGNLLIDVILIIFYSLIGF